MKWLLLGGAIAAEVTGTLTLRATVDHPGWIPVVIVAYCAAFALLAQTLRAGMHIGVAYGIWGASGVALVAVLGVVIFGETLGARAIIGIALIILGVVVVETGAKTVGAASEEQVL